MYIRTCIYTTTHVYLHTHKNQMHTYIYICADIDMYRYVLYTFCKRVSRIEITTIAERDVIPESVPKMGPEHILRRLTSTFGDSRAQLFSSLRDVEMDYPLLLRSHRGGD